MTEAQMAGLMFLWGVPPKERIKGRNPWELYEYAKRMALEHIGPGRKYDQIVRFAAKWLGV